MPTVPTSRFDTIMAAKKAALAAQRDEFARAQPKKLPEVIAETVIEGRTVAQWDADVEALDEAGHDQARADRRGLVVIDVTENLPAAAVAAVHRWRAQGRPTEFSKAKESIDEVRAEAEKHQALALVEEGKADDFEKVKDEKHAEQHRRYAQTQRQKAAKLFAQVEKMTADWNRSHP